MSDENKIKLKEFNISMIFDIQPYNGEMFEYEMKVSCIEDIWYVLGYITQRKYKDIFPEDYDVAHAELVRLKINAKDESDSNKLYFLLDTKPYGSITVDYSNLNDTNANKIQEIRKIIGR